MSTPNMRSFFASLFCVYLSACSGLSQNSNAVRPRHENGFAIQISPRIKQRVQHFSTTTALCLLCWTIAVPPAYCLALEKDYFVIPLHDNANVRPPQTSKRLRPPSKLHDNANVRPPQTSKRQRQLPAKSEEEQKLEELEDLRLDQCEERGSNWEQCFFYGTDTVSVGTKGQLLKTRENVKSGPPTW
jgi:hypothetical protein